MLPVKPQGVHWILDQKHSIHGELHNDEQMERNKNNSCSLFLSKTPYHLGWDPYPFMQLWMLVSTYHTKQCPAL